MMRHSPNKRRSTGKFKKQAHHTKAANVRAMPMRGGYRL